MTEIGQLVEWARRRTAPEWLALAAGLLVFGYVGWDAALWQPQLQLMLHLLAIGAIGGVLAIGLGGGLLPRTRIDVALLALLAAFALASASALNAGMSLRAMGSITATAAMLPVALLALRHRPAWTGLVVCVPVLVLAAAGLAGLVARRVEWYAAGAPGILPPIRLPGEGTPFGSVAVAPFVIAAVLPLSLLIRPRRLRALVQGGLVALGVPLTILSGSRSAWLALGVAAIVFIAPLAWSRRRRLISPGRWTSRRVALAAGALLGTAAVAVLVAPRLTAVTSLIYRGSLWRDTLAAWSSDPLLGLGPGIMPFARQAAAPPLSLPVRQPHSHNLPLGVLGDAGLVGLAAAAALVVLFFWVAGPWRSRSLVGRGAGSLLAGFAIAGLFEDLTFLPNFNLLVVLLAAIALADADAVRWARLPDLRSWRRAAAVIASGAIGGSLAFGMVVADAGALAYRAGTDAAGAERWPASTAWLARSVAIDPWHPAGPKALVVAADAAGEPQLARAAAERAVSLNAGDGPSWTNLAILCLEAGDEGCALRSAERALETAEPFGREAVNAAFVLEALGRVGDADRAFAISLVINRLTSLAVEWPRPVDVDPGLVPEFGGQALELNLLLANAAQEEPIDAASVADPAVRALAHAVRGERAAAEETLALAERQLTESVLTWDVAVALREHWGDSLDRPLRIAEAVRGSPLPSRDTRTAVPRLEFDIAAFRAYPRDGFVGSAERLYPDPPFPWSMEQVLP